MDSIIQNTARCRICLMNECNLLSLFDTISIEDSFYLISELVVMSTNIMIAENDKKPQNICKICSDRLQNAYEFKILCERSDAILNIEIQETEDPLNMLEVNIKEEIDETCITIEDEFNTKEESFNNDIKLEQNPDQNIPITNELNICPICGKKFKLLYNLRQHKAIKHPITNKDPNSCKFCDYIPSTPVDRYQHMDQKHSDMKTIKCEKCQKGFFDKKNLNLHMVMHSGIKDNVCDICGKSFALRSNLNAHRKLHSGVKPHKCPECGMAFAEKNGLTMHRSAHLNKRKFACKECGVAFNRAVSLTRHVMRLHSTIRPYKCNFCDKAFAASGDLRRHMVVHTLAKLFKCEVCEKEYNRSSTLKVHMKIHTGEKSHVCDVCGKAFIQAHVLRSHLLTHQKKKN